MPVNAKEVKKILKNATSVFDLPKDNQNRIYKLMNAINYYESKWEKNKTGRTRALICRKANVDDHFYTPAISWMIRVGLVLVQKKKRRKNPALTHLGRDTFLNLLNIFDPIKVSPLKYNIFLENIAEIKIEASGTDKADILMNPSLHDAVASLMSLIAWTSTKEDFILTITRPKLEIPAIISEFFSQATIEFFGLIEKSLPEEALPNKPWENQTITHYYPSISDSALDPRNRYPILDEEQNDWNNLDSLWRTLTNWNNIAEKWEKGDCEIARNLVAEKLNLSSQFTKLALNDNSVREWIDKILDEDPDWLLPHIVWVISFAFKKRRSLKEWKKVSPPYYITIHSPIVFKKALALKSVLEDYRKHIIKGEKKQALKFLARFFRKSMQEEGDLILAAQYDPEFYESWRLIKERYKSPWWEAWVSCIINAALYRYIADEKPSVDLWKAFIDIAKGEHSAIEVEKLIRNGGYTFTS